MRDVVEGTMRAARTGQAGEVYHLATERNQTIRELVAAICHQMGASFDDCVEVSERRLGQDAAYLLDCTKARTQLKWTSQRTVEDAVRDTVEWVENNLPRLRELPDMYVHRE